MILNSVMGHLLNTLEIHLGFLGTTYCLDSFEHSSSFDLQLITFLFLNSIQLNLLLYCEHNWPIKS